MWGIFFLPYKMKYNGAMELDYELEYKKPCPKVQCKKESCCCGLKFVSVPAGLSIEMDPRKGDFSNAIVRFEETGDVYIYSAEGIPVLVKEGNAS